MAFFAKGTKIIMTRGDYGIPLPIKVSAHCAACGDNLLEDDTILLEVTKGDAVYVCRRKTWGDLLACDGVMSLELTQEESDGMGLGVYSWRILWLRENELQMCLIRSLLEVVV